MIDLETCGIITFILFIFAILFIRIFAVFVVAGAISTFMGLSGILWWCSAIVIFLLINAIISRLGE